MSPPWQLMTLLWERLPAAIFARWARRLAHTGTLMALLTTCACARPADVPDEAVAAHSTAGKPVAPIAIDYRLVGQPVVGQALQIELTIRTRSTMSDVAIELAGGQSLVVSNTTRQVSRIAADTPYRFTVTVLPEEAALLQLGVSVNGLIGPARQARSITIPIRLGTKKPASQTPPDLKVGPSGNVVHSLPAEERSDSRNRRP